MSLRMPGGGTLSTREEGVVCWAYFIQVGEKWTFCVLVWLTRLLLVAALTLSYTGAHLECTCRSYEEQSAAVNARREEWLVVFTV